MDQKLKKKKLKKQKLKKQKTKKNEWHLQSAQKTFTLYTGFSQMIHFTSLNFI